VSICGQAVHAGDSLRAMRLRHVTRADFASLESTARRSIRYLASWPLRFIFFRGRIVADRGSQVSVGTWRRVRRTGLVEVGENSVVHYSALTSIEGHLSVGPGSKLCRGEKLRLGPRASMRTGSRCVIEPGARIEVLGELVIGDDVYVGRDAVIVARSNVSIGSGTLIGERVSIHDANHGPADARQAFRTAPVTIGSRAWIAAGVVVTAGASVGDCTTVGANAVVVGEIPASVIAAGVPAKVVRTLPTCNSAPAT